MGERFDRIRPPRAGRGRDEREELFSAGGPGAGRGSALDCSRCGASSALDAGVALRAAIPLFLVVPWREYPIFALCPACERRAWLRIRPAGGR